MADQEKPLPPHEHPEFDDMEKPWQHEHDGQVHEHGSEPDPLYPNQLGEIRIYENEGEIQGSYVGKGWIREQFAERFLADVPPGEGLDGANYMDMGRLLRLPTGTRVEVEISYKVRQIKDEASSE